MLNLLLLGLAVVHGILFLWSLRWGDSASRRLWFLWALLFGMCYDNLITGTGSYFINSDWYEMANIPRFVLHSSILPFLILFTLSAMQTQGIPSARHPIAIWVCGCFVLLAVMYGLYHEVYLLQLEEKMSFGVVRLGDTAGGPPMATIMTNLLMLPMAAVVWRKSGWPWLFLGGLFIVVVNGATAPMAWGFLAGNFAEVVFVLALLATEKHLTQDESQA
ncbi:MAG: hypothetical protein WD005_00600 [Haliea sp.]